jgi:PAS domain S-box-containing protein
MSKQAPPTAATGDSVDLVTGLEALRSSPEFRAPVEPLDHHDHANDHFALIYESREEQFAAAIPFIRHGLERDERCLYVIDENSEEDVLDAMRAHGIDVDTALESGSLSIHTKQETHLRNGTFDPDEMIAFLGDAIDEAQEEYNGLRTAAEMGWIVDAEAEIDAFIEYEAKVNRLLSDEDCISLCQYNRERFSADVIRDVINTHPLLVHNGRVSHNVYYTPPEEFFGPDKAEREVDRLLGLLEEQTDVKAELHKRERFLRESYRITADPDLDFEAKLHELLDLARKRMGLDAAGLNHLPEWDDKFRTEYALGYGDGDGVVTAADDVWTDPGEGCYCRQVIAADEPVGKPDVRGTDWEDDPIHRDHGLTSYLGTKVTSGATPYGTLWVGSTEPRDSAFSETERTFLELIGQWVSNELERRERTDAQRNLYEIAADPDRSFEAKLDAVFDLGCERFDLELGGVATVDPDADRFEVEYVSGDHDHDHLVPGAEAALSDTYCRVTTDSASADTVADPVAVTDPVGNGFEDLVSYAEFGIRTYLGSYLEIEGGADRTFWFVSTEPREDGFSVAERAFHNLMGQWVRYELERRERERELRERTNHLRALIETTPDCIKTVAPDGTLLQMNPAGVEMVEAEAASAVTGECVYDLIAPEDRERFREFNERVCRGERGILEFDIVGLEGTRRHMETHAAPLTRPDGTTVQVALTRDITEQKQREQELKERNDRLESFASMLAHELRNPTMIGQIYSQQLPDDDAEAVEYVTNAFDRIEDIIDVMLVLTRGREAVGDRAPVAMGDAARDAWGDVDAPDAALDVELDDVIEADETYIQHLFRNLLENAVEHGGSDVAVGSLEDGFYVADDGPGIPAEDRDAIFEEGYTTTADNGGTGLGLAFVRKLAEVYEWDVAVTESAAGGARFEFRNVD